jgi:hypothetical protein
LGWTYRRWDNEPTTNSRQCAGALPVVRIPPLSRSIALIQQK